MFEGIALAISAITVSFSLGLLIAYVRGKNALRRAEGVILHQCHLIEEMRETIDSRDDRVEMLEGLLRTGDRSPTDEIERMGAKLTEARRKDQEAEAAAEASSFDDISRRLAFMEERLGHIELWCAEVCENIRRFGTAMGAKMPSAEEFSRRIRDMLSTVRDGCTEEDNHTEA